MRCAARSSPRHDANLTRGAIDAHGRVLNAFAIVERERSRDDDGDDGGDAGVLAGSSPRSSRRANHDACAAISANAAAGRALFPRTMWSPTSPRRCCPRGTLRIARAFPRRENRGADEPRVRFRDGAATRRVPDGEPSRYELSRSVIARASNDGVRVGTLNANAETEASPGRFVSTAEEPRRIDGAPSRERRGGPADRRTQRRLDVSIHISQMRHRERRATNHRARRREKPIAPAAGSACPTALLTAPSTSDEVTDVAEAVNAPPPPRRSRWDRRARSPCRASEAMPRPTARSSSPIRTRATNASRRESPRSAPVRWAR